MEPYTVAITSCGRFDLLERTLESLLPHLEGPVTKILIAEDSGDCGVINVANKFNSAQIPVEAIINVPQLGQIRSIDRLYSYIDTDWIFHCEDDWEFLSNGFIPISFAIMKKFDLCSMVSLRGQNYINIPHAFSPIDAANCKLDCHVANLKSDWGAGFVGMHFNPGLRRLRDYRIVGPYANLGLLAGENLVSRVYESLGYRIFSTSVCYVRHIGNERHVRDPFHLHTRETKLRHSILKRVVPLWLKLSPIANPFMTAQRRFDRVKPGIKNWKVLDNESC